MTITYTHDGRFEFTWSAQTAGESTLVCAVGSVKETVYFPFPAIDVHPQNVCGTGGFAVVSGALAAANLVVLLATVIIVTVAVKRLRRR